MRWQVHREHLRRGHFLLAGRLWGQGSLSEELACAMGFEVWVGGSEATPRGGETTFQVEGVLWTKAGGTGMHRAQETAAACRGRK